MKTKTAILLGVGAVAAYALSRSASASQSATVAGLGAVTPPEYAANARIDSNFQRGVPGVYSVGVMIQAVPFNTPTRSLHYPDTWKQAFAQQGITNVIVEKVAMGSPFYTDARSANWAQDALYNLVGQETPNENMIADMHFVITLRVTDLPPGAGMGDLGALPAWAAGAIVLAVIATVIGIITALTGHKIITEFVDQLAQGAKIVLTEAGKGVAGLGVGVAVAVALVGLGLMVFKKSGARVSTSKFSIGG
jgi:hypothetical protein